ncbi:16S rRNA processing protein RimM [Granulicella rosea]|uniref:Ribosome maturation factor RimM n=2 Tax=Granulicella rosea TaxID=474952 RepID=A0A239GVE2_9BACT|nr:16S rRNA processing protein RimM [Granulicella rosea]
MLAELLTDFPERFQTQPRVYLAPAGFNGHVAAAREAEVTGFWLPVGKNAGRIVLSFAGIESINDAEKLERLEVLIPEEERLELEEDAEYIDDLIGCTVYDGATPVGEVSGVDFPTTPDGTRRLEDAAPLLTVTTPAGDEVLIPYVTAYLISTDTGTKRIEMNLPAGLIDLNL